MEFTAIIAIFRHNHCNNNINNIYNKEPWTLKGIGMSCNSSLSEILEFNDTMNFFLAECYPHRREYTSYLNVRNNSNQVVHCHRMEVQWIERHSIEVNWVGELSARWALRKFYGKQQFLFSRKCVFAPKSSTYGSKIVLTRNIVCFKNINSKRKTGPSFGILIANSFAKG